MHYKTNENIESTMLDLNYDNFLTIVLKKKLRAKKFRHFKFRECSAHDFLNARANRSNSILSKLSILK